MTEKKLLTKMIMAVVANGRFLGGGFMAAPDADVSDDPLDLVILKDSGTLKMLDEFVSDKNGSHIGDDNIVYAQAKRMTIKSKEREVTITIDGEPIGILHVSYKVLPNALTAIL